MIHSRLRMTVQMVAIWPPSSVSTFMLDPFKDIDRAFMPLEQPLVWRRGKSPHQSATFSGVLLQGSMESASAGMSIDPTLADIWTVRLPRFSTVAG